MKNRKKAPGDYKKPFVKPIWCPGCGLYGIYTSLIKSFAKLNVDKNNIVMVSGIGCSSRMPFFTDTYGFHSVHGRALPTALGIHVASPQLTTVVVSGDGDGLSIGGNHFIHAARRNPDITYIMSNNAIYGMTKGQLSPTSPYGMKSSSTPLGSYDYPLNPTAMALICGATYVARGFPARADELTGLITEGMRHKGFSFIEVIAPCVTFNKSVGYQSVQIKAADIPDDHPDKDIMAAINLALDNGRTFFGKFYRVKKPTYHQRMNKLYGRVCATHDYFQLIKSSISV